MSALKPVLRPVLRAPLWRPLGDDAVPAEARGFRIPALQFSGTGAVPLAGAGGMGLPAMRFAGAGSPVAQAAGGATLPAPRFAGAGTVGGPNGGGGMALPALQFSGAGSPVVQAVGRMALPPLQFRGAGETPESETPTGSGRLSLPPVAFRGAGTPILQASGTIVLPTPRFSGAGHVVPLADGRLALPPLAFRGTGTPILQAAGGLLLPSLRFAGAGTVEEAGGEVVFEQHFQQQTGATGTTRTFAINLPSVTNGCIVVAVDHFDTGTHVAEVTWNDTEDVTEITDNNASGSVVGAYMGVLAGPTAGEHDLVVTFSANHDAGAPGIHVTLWSGVDQADPVNTFVAATTGSQTTREINFTTDEDGCAAVLAAFHFSQSGQGTISVGGTGYTQRSTQSFETLFTNPDVGSAGAKSLTYDPPGGGSTQFTTALVALNPA